MRNKVTAPPGAVKGPAGALPTPGVRRGRGPSRPSRIDETTMRFRPRAIRRGRDVADRDLLRGGDQTVVTRPNPWRRARTATSRGRRGVGDIRGEEATPSCSDGGPRPYHSK